MNERQKVTEWYLVVHNTDTVTGCGGILTATFSLLKSSPFNSWWNHFLLSGCATCMTTSKHHRLRLPPPPAFHNKYILKDKLSCIRLVRRCLWRCFTFLPKNTPKLQADQSNSAEQIIIQLLITDWQRQVITKPHTATSSKVANTKLVEHHEN